MYRNSPCHGAGGYNGLRARNITFKKAVKRVMRDQSNNQFMVQMENMLRRIVREEFDRLIQPRLSSSWAPNEWSRSETQPCPRFKLLFINSPSSIFTGSKVEAEDGSPVLIELVDVATNARVVTGPFSSSRVEIVPLNADFTEESWTVEGFKRNILKQRERKPPLLTGDLTVALKDGIGMIDVAFSDNSSWTRSRKFRLGARLTGGGAVEARSEAFGCRDQRGEPYRKHHPPSPGDEVWRLEKIAKNGVWETRLGEVGVKTVKDLRRLHATKPTLLYKVLGGGTSKRMWEAVVSHAMNCVLDETECYLYNANALDVSLLFNSVYELIKVLFINEGSFRNADQLTNYQLDQLKTEAYQNTKSFIAVDGRNFVDHPQRSLPCPQDPGFGIACPGLQHINFQGSSNPSDSSMALYLTAAGPAVQPEMLMSFEKSPAATFHMDPKILSSFKNSFRVNEHDPIQDESRSLVKRGWNEKEENTFPHHHHHDGPSNWSPGTENWITENWMESMLVSVSGTEEAGMFDVRFENIVGSPRARWCKVKAAFKLREVWKNTTTRKNKGL